MAAKDVAIRINDIHKEFILPQNKNTSLKQAAVNIVKRNNKVTQKVLDGVSFDIHKGDFFGVVGRNGSGKSTLLKLIAGVYSPTAGSIEVNGGLTPFIELGVGFNLELSGRDNVYLNGALLGFTRNQMDDMYDEIVEFAELGPFMGQKLKNYSSGMQVRLAFSIAIMAKNDILIFDEVLAVGDEAFQRKCLDVFERYKAEGQTVVLVTHDMKTVKEYCNRAALISNGKLVKVGDPIQVADEYSELNIANPVEKKSVDNVKVTISAVDGKSKSAYAVNEKMRIGVDWSKSEISADTVMVDLYRLSGEHITTFKSVNQKIIPVSDIGERRKVSLEIEPLIAPGKYKVDISFLRSSDDERLAAIYDAGEFMLKDDFSQAGVAWSGLMPLSHNWKP